MDYTILNTIIDDGEELSIDITTAEKLKKLDLIYHCDECNCYHISPSKTWADVEKAIA